MPGVRKTSGGNLTDGKGEEVRMKEVFQYVAAVIALTQKL